MKYQAYLSWNDGTPHTVALHDYNGDNLILAEGFSKKQRLHTNQKPTQDSAKFNLLWKPSLANALFTLDADIRIALEINQVVEGSPARWFTGEVKPTTKWRVTNEADSIIEIDAVDNSERLKKPFENTYRAKLQPISTVVTGILQAAGYAPGEYVVPTISEQITLFVGPQDRAPWDVLTDILRPNGYVFYFDDSGIFRLYRWQENDTPTGVLNDTNIVGELSVERKLSNKTGVIVEWYKNQTLNNVPIHEYEKYDVQPPGFTYFTGTATRRGFSFINKQDREKIANDDFEIVYVDNISAYVRWKREVRKRGNCTVELLGLCIGRASDYWWPWGPTSIDTITPGSYGTTPVTNFSYTPGNIYAEVQAVAPAQTGSSVGDYRGTSQFNIIIRGDVTVSVKQPDYLLGSSENAEKINTVYAVTEDQVANLANAIRTIQEHSQYTFTARSEFNLAIGQYVTIQSSYLNTSTVGRIVERREVESRRAQDGSIVYDYEVEQTADISTLIGTVIGGVASIPEIIPGTGTPTAPVGDPNLPGIGGGDGVIRSVELSDDSEPVETGLYMTKTYLGFWDATIGQWLAFIRNKNGVGQQRVGDQNQFMFWDGADLQIQGTARSANFATGVTGWQIQNDGTAEFNDVTVRGTVEALLGVIGGWVIGADKLADADDRLILNPEDRRIELRDSLGVLKIALGYLENVATFTASDYGLYVAPGNAVQFDGGVVLGDGDTVVQSDAAIVIRDSEGVEAGRFGSLGGGDIGLVIGKSADNQWRIMLKSNQLHIQSWNGSGWDTQGSIGSEAGGLDSVYAKLKGLVAPGVDLGDFDIGLKAPDGSRVFDFNGDYEDKAGADPFTTKTNLAFSTLEKRFGTHSLKHGGGDGVLTFPSATDNGGDWAVNVWVGRGAYDPLLFETFKITTLPDTEGSLHETVIAYERLIADPVDLTAIPSGDIELVGVQMRNVSTFFEEARDDLGQAKAVAVTPDDQYALVGVSGVTVVKTSDWTVLQSISLAFGSTVSISVTPDGAYVFLGGTLPPYLLVVRTSDWSIVSGTPAVSGAVYGKVAFTSNSAYAIVPHNNGDGLSVINLSNWSIVSGTPALAGNGRGAVVTSDDQYALVVQSGSPYFTVINLSNWSIVSGTPALEGIGNDIDITPDGQYAIIAHFGTQTLTAIKISDWSVVSGVPEISIATLNVRVAPNGDYVILSSNGVPRMYSIRISDWSVGNVIPGETDNGRVAFTSDSVKMVIARDDPTDFNGRFRVLITQSPFTPASGYDRLLIAEYQADDTAADVAQAVYEVIDAEDAYVTASVDADTVTVELVHPGNVTDATDVDTGFTVTTTQQGYSPNINPPRLIELGSDIVVAHHRDGTTDGLSLYVSGEYKGYLPILSDGWNLVHLEQDAGDIQLWVNNNSLTPVTGPGGGAQDLTLKLDTDRDIHIDELLVLDGALVPGSLLSDYYTAGIPWSEGIDYQKDLLLAAESGGRVVIPSDVISNGAVTYEGEIEYGPSSGVIFNGAVTFEGEIEYGPSTVSPPPPVGATYIQFPTCVDPGTIWEGTDWTLILNNDAYGLFFRTEGTNPAYALSFGGGVQGWAVQSHRHAFKFGNGGAYGPASHGTSNIGTGYTLYTGSNETRPRNVTIRIWRRDA